MSVNGGKEWVNSKQMGQEFIEGIGKNVYCTFKRIQKLCLKSGDVNQWDITTLSGVLRNINFVITGVDNNPFQKRIRDENSKISRLTAVRNKIAHLPTTCVSAADFTDMWNEMVNILVSFGECEDDFNHLKTSDKIAGLHFTVENEENKESTEKANQLKERGELCAALKVTFL